MTDEVILESGLQTYLIRSKYLQESEKIAQNSSATVAGHVDPHGRHFRLDIFNFPKYLSTAPSVMTAVSGAMKVTGWAGDLGSLAV